MSIDQRILQGYSYAKEVFSEMGIDVDNAVNNALSMPISMHCWQGDDFHGLESGEKALSGGIAVTGNAPGCPRNATELRDDIKHALTLIPGATKLNLHSNYAEVGSRNVDRDAYTVSDFSNWIEFAKENQLGLDFNPTFFSHATMMDGNFTLASTDEKKRRFWIEHGKRCREIGEAFGRALGQTCVVNYWMPDGFKDMPADTASYRARMAESLDEIFAAEMDSQYMVEAIESKLFGFGIESYTVASHEFSMGYAISRDKTYCLDCGHFHPTESIADKLSSVLQYVRKVLLHTSRGVRWDSDHVVTLDDELIRIMNELVAGNYLDRVYIAQDYFDGSINRIACWAIAMRNTRKALMMALLYPHDKIKQLESQGNLTERLAMQQLCKTLPYGAVWDYLCLREGKKPGITCIDDIREYERRVLSAR